MKNILGVYKAKYSPYTAVTWRSHASCFDAFQRELTGQLIAVNRWQKADNQILIIDSKIIVNGVLFVPKFPRKFVKGLSFQTQKQIKQGQYALLIDFEHLSKMRSFTCFEVGC